jgi:hypothetical protein
MQPLGTLPPPATRRNDGELRRWRTSRHEAGHSTLADQRWPAMVRRVVRRTHHAALRRLAPPSPLTWLRGDDRAARTGDIPRGSVAANVLRVLPGPIPTSRQRPRSRRAEAATTGRSARLGSPRSPPSAAVLPREHRPRPDGGMPIVGCPRWRPTIPIGSRSTSCASSRWLHTRRSSRPLALSNCPSRRSRMSPRRRSRRGPGATPAGENGNLQPPDPSAG